MQTAPIKMQVKAADIQIECHPNALRAWRCWRLLKRQFAPQKLSPQILQRLHHSEPIQVISTAGNAPYKFVAGFPSVLLIKGGHVEDAQLCIYKKLSPEGIERLAWDSVLRTILYSLDRKVGLASMYEAINQYMPAGLTREIFGRKTLSMPKLADLSGTTESAIRHQFDLLLKPVDTKTSILDKINQHKNVHPNT